MCGCSVERLVVNRAGDALARSGQVYASDEDVELVAAATPFGLKLIESLLAQSPRHPGLLLAAARGFTQYAYAFVEIPADQIEPTSISAAYAGRERARKLYLRARDYGLRGLAVAHSGFAQQLSGAPDMAIAALRREDVPLMYWTSAAWAAAISLSKDDALALADLPKVQRLADRALELDEAFEVGSIHVLQISLAMSRASPIAEQIASAHRHLDRAIDLSKGRLAAPYVAYAEGICVPANQRSEFEHVIEQATSIDPGQAPAWRLSNEVFQRRARWLRSRTDELFSGN